MVSYKLHTTVFFLLFSLVAKGTAHTLARGSYGGRRIGSSSTKYGRRKLQKEDKSDKQQQMMGKKGTPIPTATRYPSVEPTLSASPTNSFSDRPTLSPTVTARPTPIATEDPTLSPTKTASATPSLHPTLSSQPSTVPSQVSSLDPTLSNQPSFTPSVSKMQTVFPTKSPTITAQQLESNLDSLQLVDLLDFEVVINSTNMINELELTSVLQSYIKNGFAVSYPTIEMVLLYMVNFSTEDSTEDDTYSIGTRHLQQSITLYANYTCGAYFDREAPSAMSLQELQTSLLLDQESLAEAITANNALGSTVSLVGIEVADIEIHDDDSDDEDNDESNLGITIGLLGATGSICLVLLISRFAFSRHRNEQEAEVKDDDTEAAAAGQTNNDSAKIPEQPMIEFEKNEI